MIRRILAFSLSQRVFILLAAALVVAGGYKAFTNLAIDAFPDVSPTQVKIILKAPGMTPEEVESRIVVPVELEMLGIPRQQMLRSISKYGLCDITIDFEEGTDIYWARQQVSERLGAASDQFPAGVTGGMAPITTPLGEMLMFTLEGGDLTLEERRTLLDWTIRPRLRTLAGVADVNALGGKARSFQVAPDPAAMAARGITMETLLETLETANRNDGAGRVEAGEESLLVRVTGSYRTLEEIGDTLLAYRNGAPVRVKDVAEVKIGHLTRYGTVTKDGKGEAVQGLVLGLRGANAREVVEGVKRELDALKPFLPEGVEPVIFYDRGRLVDRAVFTVSKALLEAVVLVLILLLLFLQNLRAALTVAAVLPLTTLATFWLMEQAGMSANLMSLGGLAIAIGMLVDSAVVVVENVVTRLSSGAGKLPRLHLVYQAASEVSGPVVAGIVIIIIVFLPLMTLEGLEGKLFGPVAYTIVFALGSSLLLALTVVPVLASVLLKVSGHGHEEPWVVRHLSRLYVPSLQWAMDHGKIVVAGVAALLLAAGVLFAQVGKTFMPSMDEGDIIVGIETIPSITHEANAQIMGRVQRALMEQIPEVTGIVARSGSDELGLDPMGPNQTDTFLVLKPKEEWRTPDKEWLLEELRKVLSGFPGMVYGFTQPIEMRVSEMLTGTRGDVAVKVFGSDLDQLGKTAQEIMAVLEAVPGSIDTFMAANEGVRTLQLEVDREAAGRYGLSVIQIQRSLRALLEGERVGVVMEEGRRTPLLVRADASLRSDPAALENMTLALPGGGTVPLSSVVKIAETDGPVAVGRENGRRMAVVQTNVTGRDLVGFVDEAKQAVAQKVKLPEGYLLAWGGEFENQQRAAARLGLVVPLALGLIFVILFLTFGSIRHALLVMGNVPLALIGGVVGLFLAGEYLSVPASVGFIALLGIAVLNGVVMVTHFNDLRALGLPKERVVLEGAKRRLRPVLMTASIAAFGLVPLLFAEGPGSEIQRPLAVVVIGGLVTSTLLTLIVLPLAYRRFGFGKERSCHVPGNA